MKTLNKSGLYIKLRNWLSSHKKPLLIAFCSIILFGITIFTLSVLGKNPYSLENINKLSFNFKEEPKPIPVTYYSKLSGIEVKNEASITKPVTAVMIENSPDARPQSGLKEAEIVFEAIAEAGITRFMALYQNQKPEIIGPVRSVRIYYVNWLAGFDASIAHAGGSQDALNEVRNGTYRDIDQFSNSVAYWRASDRYAPHNLYTSSEKLDALNTSKGYTESDFTGFSRVDGATSEALDATNININVSSSLFNSSYAYNSETNTYSRSQAGEPHQDREKGQITPSVIIALNVNEHTLPDGHESIENIGSGTATIFQNGTIINGIWTKESKTSQIKFTDALGEEIPLVRGQTWIVAVPNGSGEVAWS